MDRNQLIKDLPLYINGFTVGFLFMRTECNIVDVTMFGLAIVSFFWHGRNERTRL